MKSSVERLESLLEFASQTAMLRIQPSRTVSQHKNFYRFEEQLQGLPGLHFGCDAGDGPWLSIERLVESKPPKPEQAMLALWLDLSSDPDKEPSMKNSVVVNDLVAIGVNTPPTQTEAEKAEHTHGVPERIRREDFSERDVLDNLFTAYKCVIWKKWAAEERERRKSIKLYASLFALYQQMQGNLGDTPLELVWGIGIAVWSDSQGDIKYPIISQLVEIMLDEENMSLYISPRSNMKPLLEVGPYDEHENPGIVRLAKTAEKHFEDIENAVSPFEPSTYESILRSAVTLLDAQGVYWPNETSADDRSVPYSKEHLTVTDTWLLFARTRSSNLFIQDIKRFESQLGKMTALPSAVAAIVTDPSTELEEEVLPSFRGMSFVGGYGVGSSQPSTSAKELYFPLPYNDEQVQIVQRLEAHDGVVVQGPPGTGKTHTIANVICHFLASGKRVLVTSMKDSALAVLRDKIPEEIRPLAISLLTSEVEGMRQFEFAINKIATEIQQIDRSAYRLEIDRIEEGIEALHATIARTDRDIAEWAKRNIESFKLNNKSIRPEEAARLVSENRDHFAWLPDPVSIDNQYSPQFTDEDIARLRSARLTVGDDLIYLGQRLPVISNFPETQKLIQVHQDLLRIDDLKRKEARGDVPQLLDNKQSTIKAAMRLLNDLSELRELRTKLSSISEPWVEKFTSYMRNNNSSDVMAYLAPLIVDIEAALSARKTFLARPISIPRDLDRDDMLMEAITNLSEGKSAFGLTGIFGRNEQKRTLSEISITGESPKSTDDWKHVLDYLSFHKQARSMLSRWNALADEIALPSFETTPDQLSKASQVIEIRNTIRQLLDMESVVIVGLESIIPSWSACSKIPGESSLLEEAKSILIHHLTQYRLAETWVTKESFLQALSGCGGDITHQISEFINGTLGRHGIEVSDIQSEWSSLMERLRKLHQYSADFQTIEYVTSLIQASGAPLWAQQLRSQVCGETNDPLLPDQWAEGWRLKRLSTHLDAIDGRQELRRLFDLRMISERNLAKAYKQAVVKRTWLKISENATPSVKAALEAFRTAIQKIGKGTGIRAARYRQDARVASDQANIAIPCWIMPHYRVSESLPSNFGAFDLVIIDEASQSDLTALPAILRAQKVLIVGDDKQVSPEGVGLDVERIQNLMARFLSNQVPLYRPLMAPDRSVYDLFKVVFAKSAVMLREHFRCVAPIIEYSKREFYNHELKPLRLPKASERLDPPLVDVYVKDGYRKDKINPAEARYIVDEIYKIVGNPAFSNRSIGVVSLLGAEQALRIMELLNVELGEDVVTRHKIACGDARTFQGKERDIMFLSMVVVPGQAHAQSKDSTAQRFNVAASRARDRMYLVRSIELDELSSADKLREGLIKHFQAPFAQNPSEVKDFRELCESPFERDIFDFLTERGYRVIPQVPVGAYRIDLVVEGDNDHRLAIECDGDRYHGPDQWDADMRRQRILERAGWRFWRSFASTFVMRRDEVIQDLVETLTHHEIHSATGRNAYTSIHVESYRISAFTNKQDSQDQTPEAAHVVESEENTLEQAVSCIKAMPSTIAEQVDIKLKEQIPQKNRMNDVLVVELGDIVKFEHSAQPGVFITAQITQSRNDLDNGYIPIHSPLAQTLLGLEEGEEGEMRVKNMAPKRIRVVEIVRQQ